MASDDDRNEDRNEDPSERGGEGSAGEGAQDQDAAASQDAPPQDPAASRGAPPQDQAASQDDSQDPAASQDAEHAAPANPESPTSPVGSDRGGKADQTSDVVEARIVRPKQRKLPVAPIVSVVAVLGLFGALYAFDASVRGEESDAFESAKERESLEGWQEFIAWAEQQGAWTRNRTPLERHVRYAGERADIRRAYIAKDMHDRAALCAMLEELGEGSPASGVARRTLSAWVDEVAEGYAMQAEMLQLPPLMRAVMGAAFVAQRDGDVCHARGTVRVTAVASRVNEAGLTVPSDQVAAIDRAVNAHLTNESLNSLASGVVGAFVERHQGSLPFDVVSRDEPASELSVVEILMRLVVVPSEEFRLPRGQTLPSVALRVEIEAVGPATRSNDVALVAFNLAEDFGLTAYQAAEGGADVGALYALMLDELVPASSNRLAQGIGTVRYDPSGGVRGYSTCRRLPTVDPGTLIRGNTRSDGTDVFSSSCEVQDDYNEMGYGDYDENSIGRPDLGYRFVVPTRSEVSVLIDSDEFSPLVFVQATCGNSGSEVGCSDIGHSTFVADPGIYTAIASTPDRDEAGRFRMAVAVRDLESLDARCAAGGTPLASGARVEGQIGRGDDHFDSECGGTGAAEHMYQLPIESRSRVRCTLESSDDLVIYARGECGERESTIGCFGPNADFEFLASTGTVNVFVDGFIAGERGEYGLTCTVNPESGLGSVADSCEAPGAIEWSEGRATLEFDLANSTADDNLRCQTTTPAPDQVYRFELSERSHVRARVTGTRNATAGFSDRCGSVDRLACSLDAGSVLDAGTHFVTVDGNAAYFPRGRLDLVTTPMATVCADLPLLRGGTTSFQLPASGAPSYFHPTCATSVGPEQIYRLRILHPSRVNIRATGTVSLALQRGCVDAVQEVVCSSYSTRRINQELLPGDYTLVVDGSAGSRVELETTIERIDADAPE